MHYLHHNALQWSASLSVICKSSAMFPQCMAIIRLAHLVWEPYVSVTASVVCLLSRVRSSKLCEIRANFAAPHRKSVSESKNMMSYFASEVVRYGIYITKQDRFKISSRSKNMMSDFAPEAANSPNVAPNPKVVQNGVWGYCFALLSDAACCKGA